MLNLIDNGTGGRVTVRAQMDENYFVKIPVCWANFLKNEGHSKLEGLHFKEPTKTFTPATAATCIAYDNLSTAIDHYGNYNNLCSMTTATWEACSDLSTTADLQRFKF